MKKPAKVRKPKAVSGHAGAHKAAPRKTHETHAELLKRHDAAVKAAKTRARDKKLAAARGWSPDSDVALCSARAVAESLRIASGRLLSDEDVLGLYWATAADADAGQSILDALAAAGMLFTYTPGKTGFAQFSLVDSGDPGWTQTSASRTAPLILGLDLPWGQPHAVVQHDGAWWSWGQPYHPDEFPEAVIDEAWSVEW